MKRSSAAALALIVVFHVVNALIARRGLVNMGTDYISVQNAAMMDYAYQWLSHPTWAEFLAFCRFHLYPPGYLFESAAILHVTGKRWLLMTLAHNTFYLALLLGCLFGLGKEIKDEATGLLACLLAALYPLIYGTFPMYFIDFALTAIVTAAVYVLYRSESFRRTGWSLLFGLVCGWGLMTKQPFGAFLAGPALCGAWGACLAAREKEYRPLRNLAAAAVVTGCLAAPHYMTHSIMTPLGMDPSPLPWHSAETLRLFTVGLWENQLTPPFFAALAVGAYFFVRRADRRPKFVFTLWILIPALIVLFMPHKKEPRHLLPLQPALALISAFGLRHFWRMRWGRVMLGALITIGLCQYYVLTYGPGLEQLASLHKGPALGYFRQYSCDITNQTRREMLEASRCYQDIGDALRRALPEILVRRPDRRPYHFMIHSAQDTSVMFMLSLSIYFWFQDYFANCRFYETRTDASQLEPMARDLDASDFFLCTVPRALDVDFRDERFFGQYRAALETSLVPVPAQATEEDWKRYEAAWGRIRSRLRPLGAIYRNEHWSLYLYRIAGPGREP